jgi:hypothetical protein
VSHCWKTLTPSKFRTQKLWEVKTKVSEAVHWMGDVFLPFIEVQHLVQVQTFLDLWLKNNVFLRKGQGQGFSHWIWIRRRTSAAFLSETRQTWAGLGKGEPQTIMLCYTDYQIWAVVEGSKMGRCVLPFVKATGAALLLSSSTGLPRGTCSLSWTLEQLLHPKEQQCPSHLKCFRVFSLLC